MKEKTLWIAETAVMIALLVTLQLVTKAFGQMVTGSCVNLVLAVSALMGPMLCGVTVALVSPVMAYLLGIAPMLVTLPAIMAGNVVFVVLLRRIAGEEPAALRKRLTGWIVAAAAKFAVLYVLVAKIICGLAAPALLKSGLLKQPMLAALPVTFAWPQLFTALIGGGAALCMVPVIRKALKR